MNNQKKKVKFFTLYGEVDEKMEQKVADIFFEYYNKKDVNLVFVIDTHEYKRKYN